MNSEAREEDFAGGGAAGGGSAGVLGVLHADRNAENILRRLLSAYTHVCVCCCELCACVDMGIGAALGTCPSALSLSFWGRKWLIFRDITGRVLCVLMRARPGARAPFVFARLRVAVCGMLSFLILCPFF